MKVVKLEVTNTPIEGLDDNGAYAITMDDGNVRLIARWAIVGGEEVALADAQNGKMAFVIERTDALVARLMGEEEAAQHLVDTREFYTGVDNWTVLGEFA